MLNNDKNLSIKNYLGNLSLNATSDYSLWKATRNLNNAFFYRFKNKTVDGQGVKWKKQVLLLSLKSFY